MPLFLRWGEKDLVIQNLDELSDFLKLKINNNRYMIKNSNNIIVSEEEKLKLEKRELVIKDIQSNECQGRTTQKIQEIDRKLENEHKTIKKARKSIK